MWLVRRKGGWILKPNSNGLESDTWLCLKDTSHLWSFFKFSSQYEIWVIENQRHITVFSSSSERKTTIGNLILIIYQEFNTAIFETVVKEQLSEVNTFLNAFLFNLICKRYSRWQGDCEQEFLFTCILHFSTKQKGRKAHETSVLTSP